MASTPVRAQELLLPVKAGFIVVTFVAAVLLNLLPWAGVLLWIKPDFVAVLVLYWCIHQPRKLGLAGAWALGLVMDIADASLFGQHALAYALLAFIGIVLHRRVLMFELRHQVLHVLPMLLAAQVIMVLVHLAAGAGFPGWSYFVGSALGAALWPVLSVLLQLPRRPKPDPDTV
ncbi:MAG: rod shape-determining protein MreD [Betaproteobacteria bacterium]|nr:rod shape-determining protein MreD [Betaproteobacteria bacterium]